MLPKSVAIPKVKTPYAAISTTSDKVDISENRYIIANIYRSWARVAESYQYQIHFCK